MGEEMKYGFITRHVFDVFSISIHPSKTKGCPNPFSDGKLCHIYGTVKVRDEYQSVYHLYNRQEDDPDIISLGGNISLTGFPVMRSKVLTISVYLYDMAHQAEISNDTLILDYSCEYPYDEFLFTKVKGQYGFADVHHATFLHAVVADVEEVSITTQDGGSSDLCGSVVAYLVGASDDVYASTVLFDNAQKDEECNSVLAKFNTPIRPYRSCVAVPAFCTLKIKVDFLDENDSRIKKTISRDINCDGLYKEVIDQNGEIRLRIYWPFCHEEFPRERGVTDQVNAKQVFAQDLKNINFSLLSEPEERITRYRSRFVKSSNISFIEVFSVLICFNGDVLDINGTITLKDSSGGSFDIFRGSDKLSTERKTLAIQCPPTLFEIKDESFRIDVSLKDGENGVVGEGICMWGDGMIDYYFDKHLCCVFKGDIAYTVVHYSLLRSSVQARVVVSFIQKDPQVPETEVRVYGSITGEYGSYEYLTPYDQENYKYKLFSRSEDDSTQFDLGSTLELTKSLLPVPSEETIILDVDLKVGQGVDQEFEVLKQVVEFKHCKSNIFAVEKGNYTFLMWVEWRKGKNRKPFTYPNFSDMKSLRRMMPNIPLKV